MIPRPSSWTHPWGWGVAAQWLPSLAHGGCQNTQAKGPTSLSPDGPLAFTYAFPTQSMHIHAFLLVLVLLERFVFNYVYISVCDECM